jgi:hypothetical protein
MEYTAVVIATPIASERIAKTVKSGVAPSRLRASLMSLTTRGSVASLVAQGHQWIHSDGPARGHEYGGDADDCRNGRDGHKRHRMHRASLRSLARRGALKPTLSEQRCQLLSTTSRSIAHVHAISAFDFSHALRCRRHATSTLVVMGAPAPRRRALRASTASRTPAASSGVPMEYVERADPRPEPISITRCRELLGEDAESMTDQDIEDVQCLIDRRRNPRLLSGALRCCAVLAKNSNEKVADPAYFGLGLAGQDRWGVGVRRRRYDGPAFAASRLRRGILRSACRVEARRSRAKDGGPEQRQLEPSDEVAHARPGAPPRRLTAPPSFPDACD